MDRRAIRNRWLACLGLFGALVGMPRPMSAGQARTVEQIVAAPQAQTNPEADRNQRDAIEWAQVLGLRDELLVQTLMRDGLDPNRANQVRAVLLEQAIENERVMAAYVAKADGFTERERRAADGELMKAGADARKTIERRLKGILSDSEMRRFWDSMEHAHVLAAMYLDERQARRPAGAVRREAPAR